MVEVSIEPKLWESVDAVGSGLSPSTTHELSFISTTLLTNRILVLNGLEYNNVTNSEKLSSISLKFNYLSINEIRPHTIVNIFTGKVCIYSNLLGSQGTSLPLTPQNR